MGHLRGERAVDMLRVALTYLRPGRDQLVHPSEADATIAASELVRDGYGYPWLVPAVNGTRLAGVIARRFR